MYYIYTLILEVSGWQQKMPGVNSKSHVVAVCKWLEKYYAD